jgi:hypothetical protein
MRSAGDFAACVKPDMNDKGIEGCTRQDNALARDHLDSALADLEK